MGRKPEHIHLTWDVLAMLDYFGGAPNKIKLNAIQYGVPVPGRYTIAQWRFRNRISVEGLAFFTLLGAMMDPPVDMKRFVRFSAQSMNFDDAGDGEGPEAAEELLRADALLEDLLSDEEKAALDGAAETTP